MLRVRLLAIFVLAAVAAAPALSIAQSPMQPLPLPRGQRFNVKIDSSPQTAAIYVNDKLYGIQGYTPSTLRLPRGSYTILLELPNFKPATVNLEVSRSQAFTVTLERAPRPAVLDVRATHDQNAVGATIVVDGTAVGTLPNRVEVGAGSHVVEVNRQGYQPFRENLQVAEGETRTLMVPLAPQVKPGSLLVTADAPNAMVYVDGFQKDTAPTVVVDLPEGPHTVEVRAGNLQPWKQVVNVVAGQQVKVAAQLQPAAAAAPAAGSLRVLSATPNADVFLDGEPKGPAGIEIKQVEPGTHIVEVRAQGYAPQRAQVDVAAGQVKTVQVDLTNAAAQGQNAGVHVISPVPDVEVFIDGASAGKAPVTRRDLTAGRHFVVVRKAGFADFKVETELRSGEMQEVLAELHASGTLRVLSNPAGATVLLDGTAMGVTPLSLNDVPAGAHLVEMKLKDFNDAKQQVTVEGGQQGIVQSDMQLTQKGPSPAEQERSQRGETSWSGIALDRGRFTIDAGAGYPYYLFLRLQVGVWRLRQYGVDVGVELRTFFFDTQVGLRPRVQLVRVEPFSLGVDITLLGGGGPTNRNSVTFEIGPIATLAAGSYVHFNFKPYLGVWSDQLCPTVGDIRDDDGKTGMIDAATKMSIPGSGSLYKTGERDVCKSRDPARMDDYHLPGTAKQMVSFGQVDPRERFTTVRFMLQASVEIAVLRSMSIFALLEGAPFQADRQTFTNKFNPVFPSTDTPPLYGKIGVTGKF